MRNHRVARRRDRCIGPKVRGRGLIVIGCYMDLVRRGKRMSVVNPCRVPFGHVKVAMLVSPRTQHEQQQMDHAGHQGQ